MGLTRDMVDTYKRYKIGTDSFIQWLAETARATGTVDDIFPAQGSQGALSTGGRLKGKARKEAKKLAATAVTAFCVPIKSYSRLATAIVKSAIQVPQTVLATLFAVIKGRKECAEWYLFNRNDLDPARTTNDNNARHWHFIEVLSLVYSILSTQHPKSSVPPAAGASSSESVNNIFEHLTLEDTLEEDQLPTEPIPLPTTSSKVRYESDTSDLDEAFAVYCLLQDANRLRHYARVTWMQYKKGEVALQTAALVTHTVCSMIKQTSDQFKEDFPHYQSRNKDDPRMWPKILKFITQGLGARTRAALSGSSDVRDLVLDENEFGAFEYIYEIMCVHTTNLACSMLFRGKHEDIPFTAEERRFAKTLSQLAVLPLNCHPIFRGDMAHKAAHAINREGQLDIWMVFSLQILWDTQRTLTNKLPTGKQILIAQFKEIKAKYTAFLDTDNLESLGVWHKRHREAIEARLRDVTSMCEHQEEDVLEFLESKAPWKAVKLRDYSFFECHPALCGLALVELYDMDQAQSVDMIGEHGFMLTVAHLYNVAKTTKTLADRIRWKDLEWFVETQGSSWVYIGDPPDRVHDFGRRLNLAFGLKYNEHLKYLRNGGQLTDYRRGHADFRRFQYCARYSELRVERRKATKRYTGKSRAHGDPVVMLNWMAKDSIDSVAESRPMSTIAMLDRFKAALEKDISAYTFNALGLYVRCFKLLRELRAHCMKEAPHDFPDEVCGLELGMNTVVAEIFNYMNGLPCHHLSMFPAAVDMLRKIIEEGGDNALVEMHTKSKRMYVQNVDPSSDEEDSFAVPVEQVVPFMMRHWFIKERKEGGVQEFEAPEGIQGFAQQLNYYRRLAHRADTEDKGFTDGECTEKEGADKETESMLMNKGLVHHSIQFSS